MIVILIPKIFALIEILFDNMHALKLLLYLTYISYAFLKQSCPSPQYGKSDHTVLQSCQTHPAAGCSRSQLCSRNLLVVVRDSR
jgi:hypothetical protein